MASSYSYDLRMKLFKALDDVLSIDIINFLVNNISVRKFLGFHLSPKISNSP
ncbi:MAG: hypothetical protein O7D30_08495 [Rickettsia endosymbiont of Ixodes persulcatus]|nr:hypothetical protein [Rickettsia endosymbiont of Ixodes persulcatus]